MSLTLTWTATEHVKHVRVKLYCCVHHYLCCALYLVCIALSLCVFLYCPACCRPICTVAASHLAIKSILYRIVSCCIIPYLVISCHITSHRVQSFRIMACYLVMHPIVSCHVTSFWILAVWQMALLKGTLRMGKSTSVAHSGSEFMPPIMEFHCCFSLMVAFVLFP